MIEKLKKHIINEATIQKAIAKHDGIEFSYTGELVPLEIVEREFNNFMNLLISETKRRLKPDEFNTGFAKAYDKGWQTAMERMEIKIKEHAGKKSVEDKE
ncbi:MAG TPA: hypothetical protein ENH46_00670 [Candidatus Pacearchaeota archaeon]|nr:hypothetical protein [Candidatus Pacearchaeota archaeon]